MLIELVDQKPKVKMCRSPKANSPQANSPSLKEYRLKNVSTMPSLAAAALSARHGRFATGSAGRALGRYCTNRQPQDDYKLDTVVLGVGISGQVRQATCLPTGRRVAVKSFNKSSMSSRRLQELRSEVDIHLAMDHPHIVRLDRVYESSNEIHLVMEQLTGGELFDLLLRKSTLDDADAADAVRQVLHAMVYMECQGVMHRDIKLENLLYETPGSRHLKLIDFGFATQLEDKGTLSDKCGTLHYVAPEVLAGCYSSKADMWSVGVTAYLLLTGKSLYSGDDAAVRKKIIEGSTELSRSFYTLSNGAVDFVQSLLSKEARRPTAVQALEHPWLRVYGRALPALSVVRGLINSARAPAARRACLSAISWSLPLEAEEAFRSAFEALDRDCDGVVSAADLRQVMLLTGRGYVEVEEIIAALDLNGDGSLSFREVLATSDAAGILADRASCFAAFRRFDVGPAGQGRLSAGKLQQTLGGCFGLTGEDLVTSVGAGEDTLVGHEEFAAFVRRVPESQTLESKGPASTMLDSLLHKGKATGSSQRDKENLSPRTRLWDKAFQGCAAEQAVGGLMVLQDLVKALHSFWGKPGKLSGKFSF